MTEDYPVSAQKFQTALGSAEDVKERPQFLGSMILEVKKVEKQGHLARKKRIQKDKDLQSAREQIRVQAHGSA